MQFSHFIFPDAPAGLYEGLCAVCGYAGAGQYRREDVLDITTSNVTAIFELTSNFICAPCFGLWSKPKHWHRGIAATPGVVRFPVIARESETPERPLWIDVLRALRAEESRALVLTTDPKKRVWPFARVSRGDTAWLYLHDPSRGVSENRAVSLSRLRLALDMIAEVYTLGFSKPVIAQSLFTSPKICQSVGLARAQALEGRLSQIRNEPEFLPALIVAQKEQTSNDNSSPTISIPDDGHERNGARRGRR